MLVSSQKIYSFCDRMSDRRPTIDRTILDWIQGQSRATAFSAKDLANLGGAAAVRKALERLTKRGELRRIRRGYYDRPKDHPLLGKTSPDPMSLVRSMMADSGAKWQVSGAYAANLLHLSEQVPAKIVILTDGVAREVKLDRLMIDFRRASPRNLVGAGRPAGLVVQALRSLRSTGTTPHIIAKLRRELKRADKAELAELVPQLPAWMQPIVGEIVQ
jgi:hypothetical protein